MSFILASFPNKIRSTLLPFMLLIFFCTKCSLSLSWHMQSARSSLDPPLKHTGLGTPERSVATEFVVPPAVTAQEGRGVVSASL